MKKVLEQNAKRLVGTLAPTVLAVAVMTGAVGPRAFAGTCRVGAASPLCGAITHPALSAEPVLLSDCALAELSDAGVFGLVSLDSQRDGRARFTDEASSLSEKFIADALFGGQTVEASLPDGTNSGQVAPLFVELNLEANSEVNNASTPLDGGPLSIEDSRNPGPAEATALFSLGATRNEFQNSFVYVPLPQAAQAGALALGLLGLGQIRRSQRLRA